MRGLVPVVVKEVSRAGSCGRETSVDRIGGMRGGRETDEEDLRGGRLVSV